MRFLATAAAALALASGPADAAPYEEFFGEGRGYEGNALAFLQRLDYKQGQFELEDAGAVITVPDGYYFLDRADASAVLEEAWGNPPDPTVLGMLFPRSSTPIDREIPWGIAISFEDIGYVSDDDADSTDYDALIRQIEADALATNELRKQGGYDPVAKVQWAERPHYERQPHIVHWAKRITWGNGGETLNYDVRMLGRHGVLSMSFIADVEALPVVKTSIPDVLGFASFTPSNTYEDYNSWWDKAAGVGIAGLVAGKVASKAGFFALAAIFLKKFWFLLLVPFAYVGKLFRRSKAEN